MEIAKLLDACLITKKVNFPVVDVPSCEGVEATIPISYVLEVNECIGNTMYRYFLGNRVTYPVVENYAKNVWSKYRLLKSMMNS